ncbi:MAG: flippase [Candidatus Omnitrophota bacterium]|nr:flippase [Candidatus Omnitrophota bacterium]
MINMPISGEKKQIIENIISLFIFQGSTYILPLITLPYLVRVLGPEKFGLVAFAQAFVYYFMVIAEYGFIHTASKKIAVSRDTNEGLVQVFNSIMLIKTILFFVCLVALTVIVAVFSKFRRDWDLYLVSYLAIMCNILFPTWFFQGMEKMKYISYLSMLSRVIFIVAIFSFVKAQSDYIYVPLSNLIGTFTASVISLWLIIKKFGIRIKAPLKTSIYSELKEGWHVFLGMASVSVYTTSNIFILGLFCRNEIVGYYKAADSIVKAFVALLSPVSQSMYPYISRLVVDSKKKAVAIIKKLLIGVGVATIIMGATIFIFAPYIVKILLGPQYTRSVIILRILSPLPFLLGTSSIVAVQGLLTFSMNKAFSSIVIFVGVINVILAFILTPLYKDIGISIALLISEMIATCAVILVFKYRRRKSVFA